MSSEVKQVYVIREAGLNILVVPQCQDCVFLNERFCKIWAVPEAKWRQESGCPNFQKAFMGNSS